MKSVTRLYQSESNSTTSASVNFKTIPYDNRRVSQTHDNTKNSNERSYFCKYHKANSTHDTKDCKVLNGKPPPASGTKSTTFNKASTNGQRRPVHSNAKHTGQASQRTSFNKHSAPAKKVKFRRNNTLQTGVEGDDNDESWDTEEEQLTLTHTLMCTDEIEDSVFLNRKADMPRESKKSNLLDQKVIVIDSASSRSVTSEPWLVKNNIDFKKGEIHNPPQRVRTAAGIVNAHFDATITFTYNKVEYTITVLVLDTKKCIPILFGSTSLIKAKAKFDFSTGVMELTAMKTFINFEFSRSAGLWYVRLHQHGNQVMSSKKHSLCQTSKVKQRQTSKVKQHTSMVTCVITDDEEFTDDTSNYSEDYDSSINLYVLQNEVTTEAERSTTVDQSTTDSSDLITVKDVVSKETTTIPKDELIAVLQNLHCDLAHAGIDICHQTISKELVIRRQACQRPSTFPPRMLRWFSRTMIHRDRMPTLGTTVFGLVTSTWR